MGGFDCTSDTQSKYRGDPLFLQNSNDPGMNYLVIVQLFSTNYPGINYLAISNYLATIILFSTTGQS